MLNTPDPLSQLAAAADVHAPGARLPLRRRRGHRALGQRRDARRDADDRGRHAGRELEPLIEHLAVWGMRWARGQMTDAELDVEFLMWDLQRRLQTEMLPNGETVLCFEFEELEKFGTWWLVASNGEVDLCSEDPGKVVDLYISSTVRSMATVWRGDIPIKRALRDKLLRVHGNAHLARTVPDWLGICLYADISPAAK